MALDLYFHPLASYCWKVLIALYENETPFTPIVVDLGDEAQRAKLARLWPFAKFPVLHDRAKGRVVAESTIVIEYLDRHYGGQIDLVPTDPEGALEARFYDRFFDIYVHEPMQKIVGDKFRPEGQKDAFGVAQAKATLTTAYSEIEAVMAERTWAAGATFGLADCAASPSLHYANRVFPFGEARKNTAAYLARLEERPSFKRVLKEAEPYKHMFPG